jgi:hypothetical protein
MIPLRAAPQTLLRLREAVAAQPVVAFSADHQSISIYLPATTQALLINQEERGTATYPNHLHAHFRHGLVLGQRNVRQQWRVPGNARVGVTVDVGLPLPARRVRVPRADVLGLQPLEFLLVAEFVGLF